MTICGLIFMIISLFSQFTLSASSVELRPSSGDFVQTVAENARRCAIQDVFDPVKFANLLNTNIFVPISYIHPGQHRYAQLHVVASLSYDLENFAEFDGNVFKLGNDDGRSLFPLKDARSGVLTDFGIVLVDGHHSVITSLYLGASSLPIKIVKDLRKQTKTHVFQQLETEELVYLIDLDGTRRIPEPEFSSLKDDANRSLVSLTGLNVRVTPTGLKFRYGSDLEPLWVKVGESIPFVEFMLADLLYSAGIKLTNEDIDLMSKERRLLEDLRKILLKHTPNHPRLKEITIIGNPTSPSALEKHLRDSVNLDRMGSIWFPTLSGIL